MTATAAVAILLPATSPLVVDLACWLLLFAVAALLAVPGAHYTSSRRPFSSTSSSPSSATLPDDIASATEGPAALYATGIQSGAYRPDPLQQVTVQKLQVSLSTIALLWLPVAEGL